MSHFINGYPVPERLTEKQIRSLFPKGILGLTTSSGIPIFPSPNGDLLLTAEETHYTLPGANSLLPHLTSTATSASTPSSPTQDDSLITPHAQGPQRFSQQWAHKGKVLQDRVHDHITMPPLLITFIDTPEFQRLRGLRQLGSTHYLYPGATNTRFEHSLGVAFLGGVMVRHIRKHQPELRVDYRDEMAVMLAGLCHDLGHGPFSHLFEEFVNRTRGSPGNNSGGGSGTSFPRWRHEDMSVRVFRHIIQKHEIRFEDFGLLEEDIQFVTHLIKGVKPGHRAPMGSRSETKRFLFDIVSNKRNGIDVDKLDYFMRDSACCWGRVAVDCHINRLIKSTRAVNFNSEWQICFEEKMALSLGDIFSLRAKLHKYVYQHRIVKVIDHMILNVLELAEGHYMILGGGGQSYSIGACVDDIDAYVRLGDWILDALEACPSTALLPAQAIISRIRARDFYHLAGIAAYRSGEVPRAEIEITHEILTHLPPQSTVITMSDVVVHVTRITYGSSDHQGAADDPISHVGFFNPKKNQDEAFHLSAKRKSPLFTPTAFEESTVFVYAKAPEHLLPVTLAFEAWKEDNCELFSTPVPTMNFTPSMKRRALESSITRREVAQMQLSQPSLTPPE